MGKRAAVHGLAAVAALLLLVGAHLVVFHLVSLRLALSAAGIFGLIALALAVHLGLLLPVAAWFRRRTRAPGGN
jgi:hypothetical protein